jgi:hypothetical protein
MCVQPLTVVPFRTTHPVLRHAAATTSGMTPATNFRAVGRGAPPSTLSRLPAFITGSASTFSINGSYFR